MQTPSYQSRREQLTTYFDRTAAVAWSRLTSDAPVSRIRATVRAGRDAMRDRLLGWLPQDMTGLRLLDAGCGTGALAAAVAGRGASVVGVDVSPALVSVASRRLDDGVRDRVEFRVGDMLDAALGEFDYVVAMDSMIHYRDDDIARMLGALAQRTRREILMTFAPRTPALAVMHAVGRLIPHREHRAPAIEPVAERRLRKLVGDSAELAAWQAADTHRVSSGFYTSQALRLIRQ